MWRFCEFIELLGEPALSKWKLKVGVSPSKKVDFICFREILLKMIKSAFYFTLKALFVLKFCPDLFEPAGKQLDQKAKITS